ncbi:MAG: VTT domain-containing protein [Bryobacteraceae bacterium]|nr:VTT domain-containing protein [Bryobacteraceae bacterium]
MPSLILLALSTLVSEDLACIAAGVMIARGDLGFLPGVAACFAGIFARDLLLYFAGRSGGALGRRLVRESRLKNASGWIQRRGVRIVFLSRFTPGLRLPVYVAAGFLQVPLGRFAGSLALAAAAWTPILVGAATLFGDRLLPATGLPLALAVLYAMLRLPQWLLVWEKRRRAVGFLRRKLRWEFWPSWAAYLPLTPYFLWLGWKHRSATVFTLSNPGIESGGLVGESKSEILRRLACVPGLVPPFHLLPASAGFAERAALALQLGGFPIVLKPDTGERGAGVRVIRDVAELRDYLREHPEDVIAQEYAPGHEFGILYARDPDEPKGRIVSITSKVFPAVTGDGKRTLAELILDDDRAVCLGSWYLKVHGQDSGRVPAPGESVQLVEVGSHSRGTVFLDGFAIWTQALEHAIDRAAKAHPGFYLGRFDIRAPSIEALKAGHSFRVIELNGVSSEPAHIYDPAVSIVAAYAALMRHWRMAFEFGAKNRALGHAPMSVRELLDLLFSAEARAAKRNLPPMQEEYSG